MDHEVLSWAGSKPEKVLLSWEFGSSDIQEGTISCIRRVGSKDVWIDVLDISQTASIKLYATAEGEPLTDNDFVCRATNLDETVDMSDCIADILQAHGNGTRIVVGLANWGTHNILLQEDCLGLFYVNDHGKGFAPLDIPGSDGRTVYPGTMALVAADELGDGSGSLELGDIALDPDGGSGGCSATSGLHLLVLLGLPLLGLVFRKR